jgi:hypothetical protein
VSVSITSLRDIMIAVVRTQIQLTKKQADALRRRAAQEGRSLAGLIRQSVDIYLSQSQSASKDSKFDRAIRAAGKFNSGGRDVSSNHDRYLADAYRG